MRVIGPGWSNVGASGTIPRIETSPRVGLIVDVPHSAEGMRSEPAVSVPVAAGTCLEASAAPEPPLEPPAERSSAHGLPTWSVVPPQANSCVCRWPSSTIPSAREPRPGVAVALGDLVQHTARRGQRLPRDGVEVLQTDRDPAQRRRVPGSEPLVGPPGSGERVLLVDPHPGVDRVRVAVVAVRPVPFADPRQARLGQFARRERPARQRLGGLADAEIGGIAHRPIISRPKPAAVVYTGPLSRSVRDQAFDVLRRRGLTTMFANPGSTEVAFLTGLPDDFTFVLGLHEGSVVGMATGYAIGRQEPSLVLLHTTAGLGNAVSALATARVNRAPLVVLVGQQDRRHLSYEPFLAGKLAGLAGDYPVKFEQPVRAQDVPGAIERAYHAAATWRGPALVIVPMDDWDEPADEEREPAAATGTVHRAAEAAPAAVDAIAAFLADAQSPAIVVGAGADDPESWAALVRLAERLVAPVFQETFGARAGFPQDHRLYLGTLPADRAALRERLAPYDTILVVGGPAFRQSGYAPGRLTEPGTRLAIVTDDPEELHRSPADVALLAPPAAVCRALADRLPARAADPPEPLALPEPPPPPAPGEPLRPATCSRRSPSGCRATPSCTRRRPSTGPSSRTGCPHASRSATSAPPRAGSASRFPG